LQFLHDALDCVDGELPITSKPLALFAMFGKCLMGATLYFPH
jgi:hypothetical protein